MPVASLWCALNSRQWVTDHSDSALQDLVPVSLCLLIQWEVEVSPILRALAYRLQGLQCVVLRYLTRLKVSLAV